MRKLRHEVTRKDAECGLIPVMSQQQRE